MYMAYSMIYFMLVQVGSLRSVLARFKPGSERSEEVPESSLEIVELLPRCFPLLVGTPGFMTQGKAGNQLAALRFSRGHFLQMMDVAWLS